MDIRKIIICLIAIICSLFYSSLSIAQESIPDLTGAWSGTSYLSIDSEGFQPSKSIITLIISKQTGLQFDGNIELNDGRVTRMRNFSGFLNEREGYIWYFGIVVEGGDLNVGYLLTNHFMKIHLKNFNSNNEIIVGRLKRKKPRAD